MNDNSDSQIEQKMVNQLAREFLKEQRNNRRWNIFFKCLLALYLFSFLAIYFSGQVELGSLSGEKHTALVDINGVISMDSEANADYIGSGLRAAFKDKNTAGVILRINSPGGSPVQAGYVNDEIIRLRQEYPDIPVYAVISDLCASGGYYIASAADEIYADKASLVGSIGVIMSGFGFVDSIEKLGVERRVRHAGKSKAFLDPFSPQKEEHIVHVDDLLDKIYQQFIATVKKGRGDRLVSGKDDLIFSGLIWTGEQSIELGLVDALGSAGYVAREVIGEEDIVDFTRRDSYLDQFAGSLGASLMNQFETKLNYQLK
ncbi:MAG: S49 family peptidase [Gammaproteobacteria bacterium]|nr:S49 family peptidase [Gammaproteobacteria bacterium]